MVAKDSGLSIADLSVFCRTNRYLKCLLTPILISRDVVNDVLVFAAQRGFVDLAQDALALGSQVDALDREYATPALHWAAMGGHELVVKLLLSHGANMATANNNYSTALHCAAVTSDRCDELLCPACSGVSLPCRSHAPAWEIIGMGQVGEYFDSDSDTDSGNDGGSGGGTGTGTGDEKTTGRWPNFQRAPYGIQNERRQAIARLLLDSGADIDAMDLGGKTALCLAVRCGNRAMVELLLERGADISLGSVSWLRSIAAGTTEEGIFRLLMERSNRNDTMKISDGELESAFFKAAFSGNEEVLKSLLGHGVAPTTTDVRTCGTALHMAATGGHSNIAGILLDQGLDINEMDYKGRTALHQTRCSEFVELVLRRGADTEARDYSGRTPLHIMAHLRDEMVATRCISVLLAGGADIEVKDIYGRTPLHRAVISSTPEVVKLLLKHNANTSVEDYEKLTPLYRAILERRPGIFQLLIQAGSAGIMET